MPFPRVALSRFFFGLFALLSMLKCAHIGMFIKHFGTSDVGVVLLYVTCCVEEDMYQNYRTFI